jgi:FkbM family methyltransferase
MLLYPFPKLFITIAQWGGLSKMVIARTWNIHCGPLDRYRLSNLLPAEIIPVLDNNMEICCSNLLTKFDFKSAIVFDVGGSYGYYALLLSRLVEGGRVFCFEPDWRSYGRLAQNLAINNIQNVIPVPICMSDCSLGLKNWCSRSDDPWNSHLVVTGHSDSHDITSVPVASLDEFSRFLNIQDKLRFIKIDVEGAELNVLKGAVYLIDNFQPLILCELHSSEVAKQVFQFLSSRMYKWKVIEHMSENRQHILAFPFKQAEHYRFLV